MSVVPETLTVLSTAPNTSDDDALFAAAMAAVTATPPPEDAPPADEPAPEVPPAPEATVTPPAEVVKPEEKTPPVEPPPRLAPALLKLMERESSVVERETKLKAAEAEITQIRNQVSAIENAQRKFKQDPVSYVRSIAPDMDLGDVAKLFWYAKLGNNAPIEYRAEATERAVNSKYDELRAEFQTERQRWVEDNQRQQEEAAYNQYVGALSAFAQAVPDEYPLVKAFSTSAPDRVQAGLFKMAQRHAQATGGQVLTPAEAAAALNKELEKVQSVFAPKPVVPPAPVKNESAGGLRNNLQSIQPNRAVNTAEDEETLFQRALEAARTGKLQ